MVLIIRKVTHMVLLVRKVTAKRTSVGFNDEVSLTDMLLGQNKQKNKRRKSIKGKFQMPGVTKVPCFLEALNLDLLKNPRKNEKNIPQKVP